MDKRCCYVLGIIFVLNVSYVFIGSRHLFTVRAYSVLTKTGNCNLTAFKEQLDLESSPPVIPVNQLSRCTNVFYNRVPKTASRTSIQVFRELAKAHGSYTTTRLCKGYGGYVNTTCLMHYLMERNVNADKFKFMLMNHFPFAEFPRALRDSAIYVNVIREPIDWFSSAFNFFKNLRKSQGMTCVYANISVGEYVRSPACCRSIPVPSALTFLCGSEPFCKSYTDGVLQRAVRRLDEDYLVVGLTERLDDYFEVLEFLMPQMFSGARETYTRIGDTAHHRTKTHKTSHLTEDERRLLKPRMSLDYTLYSAAVVRFEKMIRAVRILKQSRATQMDSNRK